MFSASKTYEKQLRIEKTRLSHQVWSHGGSTLKKKRTLNGHFSRPAETDPYVKTKEKPRQKRDETESHEMKDFLQGNFFNWAPPEFARCWPVREGSGYQIG